MEDTKIEMGDEVVHDYVPVAIVSPEPTLTVDAAAEVTSPAEAETVAAPAAKAHDAKTATVRAILKSVRDSLDNAIRLLEEGENAGAAEAMAGAADSVATLVQPSSSASAISPRPFHEAAPDDRTIEGVFDGDKMVGADGKTYIVPPNYASKSKLVEGDMLKLIIGERGNFIYKQIGPIDRQRIVGSVSYDQAASQFIVLAAGRSWKVLKASVTYFKGEAGDEAVILVPKNAPSRWAAVENIIKRNPLLNSY